MAAQLSVTYAMPVEDDLAWHLAQERRVRSWTQTMGTYSDETTALQMNWLSRLLVGIARPMEERWLKVIGAGVCSQSGKGYHRPLDAQF